LVVEDIYKDLHRTLPSHSLLKSDSGRASLQRVLTAFAIHNPLIGYCQGLNFIAGALLTVMPTESMAFSIMARLIGRRMCCYTRSMCGTLVDARLVGADRVNVVTTGGRPPTGDNGCAGVDDAADDGGGAIKGGVIVRIGDEVDIDDVIV
jgi:hypothetical protein